MSNQKRETNRNKLRQVIINSDGSKKVVFHDKPFNSPRFANLKAIWDSLNQRPKYNSKRQQKLRAEAEKVEQLKQAA